MVEPISATLTALGFLTAKELAGFVFTDVLLPLTEETAKDYLKDFFKERISNVANIGNIKPLQKAVGQALKEFLFLFQEELVFCGIETQEIKQKYRKPIKQFVYADTIKPMLGKAFENDCRSIDISGLVDTWKNLDLPTLPEEFDWEQISKQYLRKVKVIIKETDELRVILDSENLEVIRLKIEENAPIPVNFNLEQYRENIKEFYGYLKLDTLHTSGYNYRLELWKMFVPQLAKEALPLVDIPKDYLRELQTQNQLDQVDELESFTEKYINIPVRSILEIIEDKSCQYMVILGDPGSGKSTLTQYITLNWAEQKSKNIPLLIELRKYIKDRNLPKDFLEFFHQGSDVICRLNRHQLHHSLEEGNALVMFDGLDEVFDPAVRDTIITEIIRFTNEYKKVRVVVTSRIIGYKSQRLRDAQFRHFTLQDLELKQIKEFIKKWHNLAFGNNPDKLRLQTRLLDAINYSPAIRELAGNPLLLTMMAILNRNQELPRDRAELYEQASRVLLQEWDVNKNLPIPVDTIGRQEKQAMLRKVAYFMQSASEGLKGNLIKADDLEKILKDYLKKIEVESPLKIAKLIIKQLRERNFILCFLGADTYGFVHRTFLEYFCAWEFVWQFEKEKVIDINFLINEIFGKHWQDESWHELLKLISAMIEPKFAGKIINFLIQQAGEEFEFINLFLASDCLFEVRNRQDLKDISEILLIKLKDLINYGDLYSENTTEHQRDSINKIRSLTIEKIAKTWKEKETTLTWLKEFIEQEYSHKTDFIPYAAVRAIATYWQHEPETLPLIKRCSRSALNKYVRQSAILELGRLWRDDVQTFTILIDALNDSTPDVRWATVRVMSQYFSEHDQTKSLLQNCCQSDEHFYVRHIAIKAVISHWNQDSVVRHLVYQCAKNDPFKRDNDWDSNPRQTALEAIVQYYPNHSDTLDLLQDRVVNDPDPKVREIAQQQIVGYLSYS